MAPFIYAGLSRCPLGQIYIILQAHRSTACRLAWRRSCCCRRYVTTNLMTPVQTFLSEKTAEKACQYRQTPVSDESQFLILVSSLRYDADGSHTEKVMSAFHGQKGFLVLPICEHVEIDYSKGMPEADLETQRRATDLIKARHADLLLYGEVREQDKAVKVWAVNENGGCDPKADDF